MAVTFKETTYGEYGRCLLGENGKASILITLDRGPRLLSFALTGKENILYEAPAGQINDMTPAYEDFYGKGKAFHITGGHRAWVAPEHPVHTYYPDSEPVPYEIKGNSVILTPSAQKETGFAFTCTFTLDEDAARVTAKHTLKNIGSKAQIAAPWSITMMSRGGVEIVPQSVKAPELLSNRNLVLWPYMSVKDDRFLLTDTFITLKQEESAHSAFKIGQFVDEGWAAYLNRGQLFVKHFGADENAAYPDHNCNYETYTNADFLEMESLGPIAPIQPDAEVSNTEQWELFPCDASFDRKDEAAIAAFVKAHIAR